jgi:hypothetical protein
VRSDDLLRAVSAVLKLEQRSKSRAAAMCEAASSRRPSVGTIADRRAMLGEMRRRAPGQCEQWLAGVEREVGGYERGRPFSILGATEAQ